MASLLFELIVVLQVRSLSPVGKRATFRLVVCSQFCNRFGQKHPVHAKVYYTPISVESRLLEWRKSRSKEGDGEGNPTDKLERTTFVYAMVDSDEEYEDDYDEDAASVDHLGGAEIENIGVDDRHVALK